MKRNRFSESQIVKAIKEHESWILRSKLTPIDGL